MNHYTPDRQDQPSAYQRKRLCNLETAGAVATQMTETTGRPTVIIDTKDIIQPYRVAFYDEIDPSSTIVAEIHMAA